MCFGSEFHVVLQYCAVLLSSSTVGNRIATTEALESSKEQLLLCRNQKEASTTNYSESSQSTDSSFAVRSFARTEHRESINQSINQSMDHQKVQESKLSSSQALLCCTRARGMFAHRCSSTGSSSSECIYLCCSCSRMDGVLSPLLTCAVCRCRH